MFHHAVHKHSADLSPLLRTLDPAEFGDVSGRCRNLFASDRWTIKTRLHKQLLPPDSWCRRACPSLCPFSLLPPFPLTPSLPPCLLPPFAVQSLSYYSLLASVKRFHFVDTMKTGRIHYLALHSSHPLRRTAPLQPNRTLHPSPNHPPALFTLLLPHNESIFCCYGAVFSVL